MLEKFVMLDARVHICGQLAVSEEQCLQRPARMGAWAHGCMGAQTYGRMGAQMHGCMGAHMHGRMCAWEHGCGRLDGQWWVTVDEVCPYLGSILVTTSFPFPATHVY